MLCCLRFARLAVARLAVVFRLLWLYAARAMPVSPRLVAANRSGRRREGTTSGWIAREAELQRMTAESARVFQLASKEAFLRRGGSVCSLCEHKHVGQHRNVGEEDWRAKHCDRDILTHGTESNNYVDQLQPEVYYPIIGSGNRQMKSKLMKTYNKINTCSIKSQPKLVDSERV